MRGQIISLDFLISVGLVIIAIGLLVQFFESNSYEQKQDSLFDELKSVGYSAAENLVGSNQINCAISEQQNYKISNCVNLQNLNDDAAIKNLLGIPNEYKWSLAWNNETRGEVHNGEDVYSEKRKVLLSTGFVRKADLMDCIYSGSCSLQNTEMELKVWK